MRRLIILIIILAAAIALYQLGLKDYLTLEAIKASQGNFAQSYADDPVLVIGIFFLVYVVSTAFSLPGAALLTLLGGALFGVVTGTIVVSFASTIGATLAFLGSRFFLRDWVQAKFGDKLKAINDGVAKDGAFYLFSLRLIPVVPFFVINLAMGLTPIKTRTYYWVSQLGMFLGTLVYVNAGTQLAQINSLGDIASPGLLASFAALGLFPWIARGIMNLIKRRRVYKGWTKPKSYDRNMVVIGAGAAGLVSSLIGATVKAKVTLVEGHKMGGDCLNFGCVPSKALIKSAKVAEQMRHADRYGLTPVDPKYSFKAVIERVHAAIAAIEPNDSVERYTGLGVDVAEGHARIVDPWTVEITPHQGVAYRLTTRSIIIATGARPFVPPLPGIQESGYLTSDTLWEVMANRDAPPARLTVLGGGPIGCELAQAFARLGSKVTLVEMAPRVMIREDEDVAALAAEALAESGVELLTAHRALRVEGKAIIVAGPDGAERSIAFDDLLVAVGRAARLSGFGLEELGIETGKTVAVNDYMETKYPNILAAGDVAGPYQFTHTASHSAWYASVNALFGTFRKFKADYRVIPWTTYIDPEVARVGLNEQEAKELGIAHEVTLFPLHELDRAITDSATKGFVKLLTVPGKDKILGVTIVGEHAGDIIGEYVLAMRHGLGLNKILSTVHAYPSYIEANKFAAGRWKKANAPEWAFPWLERLHSWRRG
jgi:pyruvate/2-oxoglutarate dehydrogenase complex dihydrolipoamide dehydrogenase (E3) component/uncharacterized membrane protein YdjX (TVP38/TMEM64 family)